MHPSAKRNALKFRDKYLSGFGNYLILDVGSYNVNGSLRDVFDLPDILYIGCDIAPGPGVDVVIENRIFPWADQTFDCTVSSSCFEHDPMFWVTFDLMVRVTKIGGFIYLCVPSRGPYHGYPGDCWRFMKDSYKALEEWNGKVDLVEQYIDQSSKWEDNIGIFQRVK